MKRYGKKQPRYRLLKASCVGAGLLSISNPSQLTAADIGVYDVHNDAAIFSIPNPFPDSTLGVHVAAGDLNGDGFSEIIVGPGRGAPQVVVDGKHFPKVNIDLSSTLPSGTGVRVATGDLDGDGHADIVATPATGAASPGVYIKMGGVDGESPELLGEFDDIFDGFSGGVSVATGDVDGDMTTDVIAARAGCCKWDYNIKKAQLNTAFTDFGPPIPAGSGGVQVATGDLDGDGIPDIVIAPQNSATGAQQLLLTLSTNKHTEWIEMESFGTEPTGVHVALGDIDGDSIPDLVVGAARHSSPYIKIYGIEETPGVAGSFSTFLKVEIPVYDSSFRGGVRVAIGDVNNDGYGDIVYGPAGIPEPATIASIFAGLGAWLLGGWRRRRDKSPPA